MPHPAARKLQGGRRGPRQVTGKRQVKATLRPGPVKAASRAADAPDEANDDEDADEEEEAMEVDGAEAARGTDGTGSYGYRQALQREKPPLVGFRVSISGCARIKDELWELAVEYGAERHTGLLANTTHLVAETRDSEKYRVALERGIRVMLPSWLWAVQAAWKSGNVVDYARLEAEHRMQPLAGEYKDFIKSELVRNGAQIAQTFDKAVTHLIVAAPTSPHSQTPSSDKLVQARKNRHHLHPCLAVVWEGWIEAAIARGGLHANDTKLWTWREGEGPPVPPTVSAMPAAGRRGSPAPGRDQRPSVLCAPSIPSLDVEASEPDARPSVAPQDDAQILKKRRIAQASSLDNREGELAWALQLPTAQAAGASGNATIERRPVLSDADGLREVREPKADRAAGVKKTAIRALGERRSEVWTAARSDAKSLRADAAVADTNERLESGSFGAATRVRSGSHEPEATSTAAVPTIFADQSFALMELKGPDPSRLAEVVRAHGGTPHLDPASDQLAAADWVVVDYVEPSQQFFQSDDPRVVSVCWLELCIYAGALLPPADRLLERPLPYHCPLPGAEALHVHFSGFSDDGPVLHHIRRFMSAIGATYSRQLSRKVTHLVLASLDSVPNASEDRLRAANPTKVAKALEWGIPVVSLRELRLQVDSLAVFDGTVTTALQPAASSLDLKDVTNQYTDPGERRSASEHAGTPLKAVEQDLPHSTLAPVLKPVDASPRSRSPAAPASTTPPAPVPVDRTRRASAQPARDPVPKGLLRQQTSLLLAQLGASTDPAAETPRGRAVPARTRTHRDKFGSEPAREGHLITEIQAPRPSPPQATQDEGESIRVDYDDSEQAAARAQILKTLAMADGRAQDVPETPGSTRTLRKRSRA
ncbi:protein kinase activating protein dpb11 [Rhodotorula sphaerocarpa]